MKKMMIALFLLCSFQIMADDCDDKKLEAEVTYTSNISALEKGLDLDIGNFFSYKEFGENIKSIKERFLKNLNDKQRELYSKDFKAALKIWPINYQLNHIFTDRYFGSATSIKIINDRYWWVCLSHLYYKSYPEEQGRKNYSYCSMFDLKELKAVPDQEGNEVSVYIKYGDNPVHVPLKIYSKILNLTKYTKEKFIEEKSAAYCKQTVSTNSRSSEQKEKEKENSISQGSESVK